VELPPLPHVEDGVIGHAVFRIEIPENWNGGLVMWAHRYGRRPPKPEDIGGFAARTIYDKATEMGYAVARSGFSNQGFNLREGVFDTEALRDYFERKYGPTYPTLVAGHHLGGSLTYIIIERYPESYDGALAFSGSATPSLVGYKVMFDMRLIFDHFFPPGLPGSVVDHSVPFDARTEVPKLVAQHPERLDEMLRMFKLDNLAQLAWALSIYSGLLRDINVDRAGGNPFDNTNTVYSGSDDDLKLNREVPRYTADPKAAEYMRQWFTITGNIKDPVLAVNAMVDPLVPIWVTERYDAATQLAGTNHLYVQQWVAETDNTRHKPENIRRAFEELIEWVVGGKRPEPGELTVP
jgi:pimeloyl-ACP methyl ester carboxylesterase